MSTAPRYQDQLYIGADYSLSFIMKNPDGTLVDLSGASAFAKFKYKIEDPDSEAIPLTCITDVILGQITVSLANTETVGLLPGVGGFDIILEDSLGKLEPLLFVDLEITPSPTLTPFVG